MLLAARNAFVVAALQRPSTERSGPSCHVPNQLVRCLTLPPPSSLPSHACQIENEDQLLGAQQRNQEQPEQEEQKGPQQEEERGKGIEMEADFEGALEDVPMDEEVRGGGGQRGRAEREGGRVRCVCVWGGCLRTLSLNSAELILVALCGKACAAAVAVANFELVA